MKTAAAWPYLTPEPDALIASAWIDGSGAMLGETVDHWDSATDLLLSRSVTVDADRVRQECQLGPDAAFAVTATWQSGATRLAGGPSPIELGTLGGRLEVPVSLVVPGAEVGGTVRLRTRLVLRHPGRVSSPLAPAWVGSVLWSDEQTCAVEGSAGQFPIAVIDFGSNDYPTGAAWALNWGSGRLHEPVLGDFQLFLNSEHPAVMATFGSDSDDPRATAFRSVVRYEVLRTIVYTALADEEFCVRPDQYDEGSVGELANELIRLAFDDSDLKTLSGWLRDRPDKIDTAVQSYAELLA